MNQIIGPGFSCNYWTFDPDFCFIYIILGTPCIHWSAYISIMQQTGARPSAAIMAAKLKKRNLWVM